MQYHVNDTVLYGTEGVCRYAGISEKEMAGSRQAYHILKPIYNETSLIFIPVGNEKLLAKMRRILSKQEVYALIQSMPDESTIWIEDEALRRERYKEILAAGDRKELVRLIKTMRQRAQEQKERGKKLHVADERILKEAEKLLHDEFAHVLDIDREQVLPFILKHIPAETERQAQSEQLRVI